MQLKCRQIERTAEAVPVDRQELKVGDTIERYGSPCVVCPRLFAEALRSCKTGIVAAHIGSDGWTDLSDTSTPSFRIHNLRQDSDGKWHWDRVVEKPKPVKWEELNIGEYFMDIDDNVKDLFQLVFYDDKALGSRVRTGRAFGYGAFAGDTLYRARIVGFDKETEELLWETY